MAARDVETEPGAVLLQVVAALTPHCTPVTLRTADGGYQSETNRQAGRARFTLRGRAKVDGPWELCCLVHNIEGFAPAEYAAERRDPRTTRRFVRRLTMLRAPPSVPIGTGSCAMEARLQGKRGLRDRSRRPHTCPHKNRPVLADLLREFRCCRAGASSSR